VGSVLRASPRSSVNSELERSARWLSFCAHSKLMTRLNSVIPSAYLLRCQKIKVVQVGKSLISIPSKLWRAFTFHRADVYRGTFRPDRVRAVAERYGVDGNMALENVLCARAWSSEQQCELLLELAVK
jgi:hypothetical protein